MEECLRLSEIYGNVARGFLGYKVVVFLTDPRDVELILNNNVHLQKSSEYRFFKPWLGDGLLISNGEKWRSHRKLIAPAFHQLVLKSFVGAFNRNSVRVVERLRGEVGHEFDVHDYMSEVTVDILLGSTFNTICLNKIMINSAAIGMNHRDNQFFSGMFRNGNGTSKNA